MTTPTRHTLTLAAGLVALIAMIGCSSDAPAKKDSPTSLLNSAAPQGPAMADAATTPAIDAPLPVYFAQNECTLNDDMKAILKKNVDWLENQPPFRLEIDGYADSRGTPEQALAMSQRRASAIREYYVQLGIPRQRIATIAFGETNPVCVQDTEDCWKQNRRAETHVDDKPLAKR